MNNFLRATNAKKAYNALKTKISLIKTGSGSFDDPPDPKIVKSIMIAVAANKK